MKILVTGGSGFIGSHLCERLLAEGHVVINLDNFNDFYAPEIKWKNIANCLKNDSFHLVEGDIRDIELTDGIFQKEKIELVIHLAAMAGVRPSLDNPVYYSSVNINGTQNILENCRNYGVKRLIFASSSSVYGNNDKVPFSEADSVDHPISPYAATKKAGELLCHTYHHNFEMSIICLRFFTVYGARQRPDLAIHKFTRLLSEGKELPLFGNGSTSRDYTYIEDIIKGITGAIDFVKNNNIYEVINLGESQTITLLEMVKTLENEMRIKGHYKWLPAQPGDMEKTFADISKAKKMLGYVPKTEFSAGIREFLKWFNNNKMYNSEEL
ncbi:MAG: GDP-mannose 4,6-dehydratase [Candidatus Cloacimonetes bacterium]|nr:GDP-mannose 4,6-dehydratase [Candidatus Cloacimonadota bacterium]